MKFPYSALWLSLFLTLPMSVAGSSRPPEGKRFLFIVDTSLEMSRQAKTMPNEVMKLLQTEMQGRLKEGDTIGFWTYGEDLQTGEMPLQQWRRDQGRIIMARISDYLGTRRFRGFSEFTKVTPELLAVVKHSADITVLLVSDGGHPVVGTPFDAAINANFNEHGGEMRRLGMPFITVLVAQHGGFVSYAVNSPFQPVRIPRPPSRVVSREPAPVPAEEQPVQPPTPMVATATSMSTNGVKTVVVSVPDKSSGTQLKIVEKWPAPEPKPLEAAATPVEEAARQPAEPPPVVEPAQIASVTTPPTEINPEPKAVAPPASAVAPRAESLPEVVTVISETPDPPARASAKTTEPRVVVAASESSPFTARGLLTALLVLLVLIVLLVFSIIRRVRQVSQPSLITASMNQAAGGSANGAFLGTGHTTRNQLVLK